MKLFARKLVVTGNVYRYRIGSTSGDVLYKNQYGFSDWAHVQS
jgi:hypothetical protein